jgi:hypothetical protein
MFLEIKTMPREWEAQWWLSGKMCYFSLWGKPSKYCLSLKKKSDFNSTILSMYYIGPSLFTGRDGLAEYLVYSPRFIYVFQQPKTSFLLCSTRRGLCLHPVCLWLGLDDLPLCFVFPGSLELVPWYCNNFYSNSVLFEVRNVITSLLGLVIISH